MARTNRTVAEPVGLGATPSLIRWGAVFGGAVMGLSLLVLLSTLWLALGYGNATAAVTDNMAWFLGGSAIVAMFAGGLLAGWLSGVPGPGPGFFNGVTVWGLILIAALVIGPATFLQTMGTPTAGEAEQAIGQLSVQGNALWATFVSLLVGVLAAGLGGTIGGAVTHPAFVYAAPAMDTHDAWTDRRSAHIEGATVDIREDDRAPREREAVERDGGRR